MVCECWGAWGGEGGGGGTPPCPQQPRWPQSGVKCGYGPHNPSIRALAALLTGMGSTELWCPYPPATCSLGKVLMSLITGLVCAINVYFVVDFLPTLRGLGYLIPLGLLLVAYVAFVAYLVRAKGGWGCVEVLTLLQPRCLQRVPSLPSALDVQHRARSAVPAQGTLQPVQLRSHHGRAGGGRAAVTGSVPHNSALLLHQAPGGDAF